MKIFPGISGCMLFFLVSCSPYQKVSSITFSEYDIHGTDKTSVDYVLKKRNLHYSSAVAQNNFNTYDRADGALIDSQSTLEENHLIIPKGAHGICVNATIDQLHIDFGKGIIIPFRIYSHDNSPGNQIVIDQRTYGIVVKKRTASLYFDVTNHTGSKR